MKRFLQCVLCLHFLVLFSSDLLALTVTAPSVFHVSNQEPSSTVAEDTTACPPEICNGVDDNCDGLVDEGCQFITYYRDADGDTYGNPADSITSTTPPTGYVQRSGDCNDANATIRPDRPEMCNGIDENCNGVVDEGCQVFTYYRDVDGDTFGNSADSIHTTLPLPGYAVRGGDCNDTISTINPFAQESLNGRDDNCNGQIDEFTDLRYYYRDLDRDGYGRNDDSIPDYSKPDGYVLLKGDCADWDVTIHPGITETANGVDDNCNGQVDEGLPTQIYYRDVDKDGYGRNNDTLRAAVRPLGYVAASGDCADWDVTIYPGAPEIANRVDDNCNGQIDEGLPTSIYYRDVDKDGYGRNNDTLRAAVRPLGYVAAGGDCADWDITIYPGAAEIANRVDDNCNGQIDEGLPTLVYYRDVDGDVYGRDNDTLRAAVRPLGYVAVGGDCVDWDASINPGAAEIDNNQDDNCNGLVDEDINLVSNARTTQQPKKMEDAATAFTVTVSPVPTTHQFNVFLKGANYEERVRITVFDQSGRIMEIRNNLTNGQTVKLGADYPKGYYILEAVQGKERKVIRLLKL